MEGLEIVADKNNVEIVEVTDESIKISGTGLLTVLLLIFRVLEIVSLPWYIIALPVVINFVISLIFEIMAQIGIRRKIIYQLEKMVDINETGARMIVLMKTHLGMVEKEE